MTSSVDDEGLHPTLDAIANNKAKLQHFMPQRYEKNVTYGENIAYQHFGVTAIANRLYLRIFINNARIYHR
jgi:hypothetical protein